ncbi:kinase-like domain-containing protein [Plectosphaerella cucumerina]|uniref:Kinase-like domain-containing protein n=1 Tax=Plectosphaerella cucumerina TaxID=40658 RepID=A0A8K0X4D2_9PEZI|nr:kinase-like domain-containing protein [Plectosphaerella cucumerina]
MARSNVAPDPVLLTSILPETDQQLSTEIWKQNWDQCVFKAVPDAAEATPKVVRLVRMNKRPSRFQVVSAMQQIAAIVIPNLAPQISRTGTAANQQGELFEFCVMDYMEGVPLVQVWEQMPAEDQETVVAALIEALRLLHTLRLFDDKVQAILQTGNVPPGAVMGGPSTGFLEDGPSLLQAVTEKLRLKSAFHTSTDTTCPDGVVIQSDFSDLGSVTLEDTTMGRWANEAVFCHNDLNPGNVIVRPSHTVDGTTRYCLAAIIDWELSGFYPPSYELSLQDTYLSSANRLVTYYLLLKRGMERIVPHTTPQESLLRALEILFESQQRRLLEGTNIPARIRQRFLKQAGLHRDKNLYLGWTQKCSKPSPSLAESQEMEDRVVEEMTARR